MSHSRPDDPRLAALAAAIEQTGWAAEVCDAEWRLVWVSSQMKLLMGEHDDVTLGVGRHVLDARAQPVWTDSVPITARRRWILDNVPFWLADTPGGADALVALAPPELEPDIRAAAPAPIALSTAMLDTRGGRLPIGIVRYFAAQATADDGTRVGSVYLYGSNLPASLLALVARGDARMFARMAALVEPGRHEAAVLFADLQASGTLSRRLPSAAYFELVRTLMTAMDDAIGVHQGVVGKHGGDGAVAFFLADDSGSRSGAARSAIEAARQMSRRTREAADRLPLVDAGDLMLNIGLHWGGTLYMGQVVTGGRLEVTALGDEVNETARIQQAAREGALLASKALIERLGDDDAAAVGIDPAATAYRALAEVPGAEPKAVRDAGTLAVTVLDP